MSFNDVNFSTISSLIASLFEEILRETDLVQNGLKTKFNSKSKPKIHIEDYIKRIMTFFKCSEESLILAMIYIDKLSELQSHFIINSYNIHRLLITAMTVAVKFFEDTYYTNAYYAKVGGLPLKELNILEEEFLHLIDYRLHVSSEHFLQYKEKLELHLYHLQ